jgi:hypothetical protein
MNKKKEKRDKTEKILHSDRSNEKNKSLEGNTHV